MPKTHWTDEMVLTSVRDGDMLTGPATERAHELARAGLIDTSGTWRLTARGRARLRESGRYVQREVLDGDILDGDRVPDGDDGYEAFGRDMTPNRALTRSKLEAIAWAKTPADYRGSSGSRREVLINTTQGTTLVPLSSLTDFQLRKYIGAGALEEAGDMRKNGEAQDPELAFIEEVKSRLDIGDRQVRFSVGGGKPGTPYYTGQMFINFYNVPPGHGGAEAENNRLMLQVRGFQGASAPDKLKVELSVQGPSFNDARFRLRAKSASPEKIADYIADFLNLAAKKAPYGHVFSNYEKNSREAADETAARELSLYIENEYSLVGAPNSQGQSIEKNLLRKIKSGSFDLKLSEKAWMYLVEAGAKKYAKEFASPGEWSKIFTKPTRELVAYEFATTFYEEYKLGNKSLTPNTDGLKAQGITIEEFDAPAVWASASSMDARVAPRSSDIRPRSRTRTPCRTRSGV